MVVAAQPESCKARTSVESAHLFVATFRFTKANVGFISGIDVEVTLMMCVPDSVCTSENLVSCELSFSVAAPEAWGLFSFFDWRHILGKIWVLSYLLARYVSFDSIVSLHIGRIGFDLQCSG
jgi:hypothetical protein